MTNSKMEAFVTKTEKETFEFAREFTKNLKGGDVVGLVGNLGAGKTVFSKGIADGLGIKEEITSPTFVYMKIYEVKDHLSIKKMCHIDAYRIENEQLLLDIGVLEYFNNPDVLTVIEWADKQEIVEYIEIEIRIDKNLRKINVSF